jgi:hypothetical protein
VKEGERGREDERGRKEIKGVISTLDATSRCRVEDCDHQRYEEWNDCIVSLAQYLPTQHPKSKETFSSLICVTK